MGLLDFLFGNKNKQLEDFKSRDAIVLDVRTKGEFANGAIANCKHIPLADLSTRISEVKKWNKPVITYCAAGMRSAQAASILRSNGIEVMNGGGYNSLKKKL